MSEMLQLTERVRGSRRGRGFRRYRPLGFEPCEGRLLLAASGVDDVASFGMRLTTVGVAAAETQGIVRRIWAEMDSRCNAAVCARTEAKGFTGRR